MKFGFDDLYEGPRFQRARRRKIKLLISSIAAIIGIVLVIGIINIFSGDEEASTKPEEATGTEQTADTNEDAANDSEAEDQDTTVEDSFDSDSTGNSNNSDQTEIDDEEEDFSPSNNNLDSESQVVGTVEKNWEPVGTEQQGEHVTDFTKGSQDWQEMTQAVSSATGLTNDNMIIWWMGNGGAPNKAVSTVSSKDKQTYYRVQLEWVNNEGWKPVKVEQVEGNDSKPTTDTTNDNTTN